MLFTRTNIYAILISSALLLSACSTRLHQFTFVTTKNIDVSQMQHLKTASHRTNTEAKSSIIVIIPNKIIRVEDAIDKAIEATPGCVALKDIVVRAKWFYIPYIYAEAGFVVEATPIIDPSFNVLGDSYLNTSKTFRVTNKGDIIKIY